MEFNVIKMEGHHVHYFMVMAMAMVIIIILLAIINTSDYNIFEGAPTAIITMVKLKFMVLTIVVGIAIKGLFIIGIELKKSFIKINLVNYTIKFFFKLKIDLNDFLIVKTQRIIIKVSCFEEHFIRGIVLELMIE